jgi:hypothetical protein
VVLLCLPASMTVVQRIKVHTDEGLLGPRCRLSSQVVLAGLRWAASARAKKNRCDLIWLSRRGGKAGMADSLKRPQARLRKVGRRR